MLHTLLRKLKHHFFEVNFQNERKGCFNAAVALVAARRLYLMILRFVEFFCLSCGGGTPTSDNFQKSKEKNWENLDFFEAMQWATLKYMSEVHLWLSFGYLFELAVSDENYPFYAPLKFSSSLRRANIAT